MSFILFCTSDFPVQKIRLFGHCFFDRYQSFFLLFKRQLSLFQVFYQKNNTNNRPAVTVKQGLLVSELLEKYRKIVSDQKLQQSILLFTAVLIKRSDALVQKLLLFF